MTNEELLQRLVSRIPPPDRPDRVDGTTLNSSYGPSIALPDDYRLFLDVYGPGWFTEAHYPALHVFDLVTGTEQAHVDMALGTAGWLHESYPDTFPRAFPTMPGLLPWGDFDQGYTFYWWADGPPDTWRVMADDRSKMILYGCSMLEFLTLNLTSLSGEKFFDDGEERFSGFWPLSKYREYQAGGLDAAS